MVLSPSATVHGVFVGAVSLVRDSRINSSVSMLEGHFTDGKKVMSFACSFPSSNKVQSSDWLILRWHHITHKILLSGFRHSYKTWVQGYMECVCLFKSNPSFSGV